MTGYTAVTLAVVGATFSAVGMIQAGNAADKAGKFNARGAKNNADASRAAAAEDARRHMRLASRRAGTNRSLDPDKLDLLEDNATEEELTRLSLIHAGEVQAIGYENNAQIEIMRGRAQRDQSRTSAFGTLLSGVGSAFLKAPSAPPTGATHLGSPFTFGDPQGIV